MELEAAEKLYPFSISWAQKDIKVLWELQKQTRLNSSQREIHTATKRTLESQVFGSAQNGAVQTPQKMAEKLENQKFPVH